MPYLLVGDELLADQPASWKLVALADRVEALRPDAPQGLNAGFTGRLGTDLDVFFAAAQQGLEREFGDATLKENGRPDFESMPLKRLTVKIPGSGDIRALLLPARRGDETVRVDAMGPGFRVQSGAATDLVFAGRRASFHEHGIRFEGNCGIVRWRDDGRLIGSVDGPDTVVFVDAPRLGAASTLTMDGKERTPRLHDGRLMLLLPAGRHEFEVSVGE